MYKDRACNFIFREGELLLYITMISVLQLSGKNGGNKTRLSSLFLIALPLTRHP